MYITEYNTNLYFLHYVPDNITSVYMWEYIREIKSGNEEKSFEYPIFVLQ